MKPAASRFSLGRHPRRSACRSVGSSTVHRQPNLLPKPCGESFGFFFAVPVDESLRLAAILELEGRFPRVGHTAFAGGMLGLFHRYGLKVPDRRRDGFLAP